MYDSCPLREDTFRKLRLNSPADGWFPALQDLHWCITKYNLPYVDLFFSPLLKEIRIFMPQAWRFSEVPRDVLPVIASTISMFPTSTLELLVIDATYHHMLPWAYFKDSLSSVILRCGPSFTQFTSPVPLSDAAVDHLISLPHLRTWRVEGPPPTYSTSRLPLVFPPLAEFTLGKGAARGWLSLFERLERGASATQGVTPLAKVKGSLKYLEVLDFSTPCPIVGGSYASTVQIFWNLAHLDVGINCPCEYNEGQCTFKLNDDNVTEFATALSQLETLFLGRPCFQNTCATTVACLLPISVRCPKLEELEIHFNTTNIVEDIKNLSVDPRYEDLRSLPRCILSYLDVHRTPLALDKPGFEIVAGGMVDIFPFLEHCQGRDPPWNELSTEIKKCKLPNHVGKCSLGFPLALIHS